MNHQIEVMEAAYRRFVKKIVDNGYELKSISPINKKRYYLIIGKPINILLTFKRDLFHCFGEKFLGEFSNEEGDTINCDELKVALQFCVGEIYSVFPDGIAYRIDIRKFMEKSFPWQNKSGKKVRSCSINEYERAFEI